MARPLDALVAANAVIKSATRQGVEVTNLKIQKILYFAHAISIVQYKVPLVDSEFEAWQYGPVCREVYHELKKFEGRPIVDLIRVYHPATGRELQIEEEISTEQMAHIDRAVLFFGRFSASELVEISHASGGPWDYTVRASDTLPNVGMVITNEVIGERCRYHWFNAKRGSLEREVYGENAPFASNGLR